MMSNVLIKTGVLLCSLLVAAYGAHAAQPDDIPEGVVEIGGTLEKWDLSSGYLVIDGTRYRTTPDVRLLFSDGSTSGVASLERNKSVLVRQAQDKVFQILILPDSPTATPH